MANIKYSPEIVQSLIESTQKGESITNACKIAGIDRSTYRDWLKDSTKPEFKEAIEIAKAAYKDSLLHNLKRSLYQRATGYTFEETTTELATDQKSGKVIVKSKRTTKKQIPPDTAALIFALTNLDPENWKNSKRTEVTGRDGKDLEFNSMEIDLDALTPEQKSTLLSLGEEVIRNREKDLVMGKRLIPVE